MSKSKPVKRPIKAIYPFLGEDDVYVSIWTYNDEWDKEVVVRLGKSVVDYKILDTTPLTIEISMSEKYALLRGQKALGGTGRGEMTIPASAFEIVRGRRTISDASDDGHSMSMHCADLKSLLDGTKTISEFSRGVWQNNEELILNSKGFKGVGNEGTLMNIVGMKIDAQDTTLIEIRDIQLRKSGVGEAIISVINANVAFTDVIFEGTRIEIYNNSSVLLNNCRFKSLDVAITVNDDAEVIFDRTTTFEKVAELLSLRGDRINPKKQMAEAFYKLAKCYDLGEGVKQDKKEAGKWYGLAKKYGFEGKQKFCMVDNSSTKYIEKDSEDTKLEVQKHRLAAEKGDAEAQNNLGKCYFDGIGIEQDPKEAVKWFQLAAKQGHADAQNNLGDCYNNDIGLEFNEKEIIKWYRLAAEQGHAVAMCNLGDFYSYNNNKEAINWYQRAAEQGNEKAQIKTGECYFKGVGVEEDKQKAIKWFRMAAEQGNAKVQVKLGVCYFKGRGVEEDKQEAMKWFRIAAEQGHSVPQTILGDFYLNGWGVVEDEVEAVKWYELAADMGNYHALNSLGCCYLDGIGVEQDRKEAFKYFRKSADENSYSEAKNNIGKCFLNGWGMGKDYGKAVKWFKRAAEQGHADAQNNLGNCYLNGWGVEKDDKEAAKWHRLAKDKG